jgi:hypothetical protein
LYPGTAVLCRESSAVIASELHAASLGSCERGLGALGYHAGFVFGDRRQDVDGEAVGLREVDGFEIDAGFHQVRHERNVARQPVQLRDDELGAVNATRGQRFG